MLRLGVVAGSADGHEWRVPYEGRERETGAPEYQPRASACRQSGMLQDQEQYR
jgi:hypothetical protein